MADKKLAANEGIKTRSNYLRGTIKEGLADTSTGSMCEDDQQLLKFHGTYQQDDRDLRPNRRKHRLEKAYSFMIRVRVPGGVTSPKQWLQMDEISTQFANERLSSLPVRRSNFTASSRRISSARCKRSIKLPWIRLPPAET